MKEKFSKKFERIHQKIVDEGFEAGFDNFIGLTYLNAMVDLVTQTPQLREALHEFIQGIMAEMGEYEFESSENDEVHRSYT